MDYETARMELAGMKRRTVLELALHQKQRWCLIGGSECGFLIQYRAHRFCVSELMNQRCCRHSEAGDQAETGGSPSEPPMGADALLRLTCLFAFPALLADPDPDLDPA